MNTKSISDRAHAEVLTIYKISTEDVERAKQRLWKMTYHTILAQGGFLALNTAYGRYELWMKLLFTFLCFGTACMAAFYVRLAKKELEVFRVRVRFCLLKFEEESHTLFKEAQDKRDASHYLMIFAATVVVLLMIWLGKVTANGQ